MITTARAAANAANARFSTGPRTEEGKARSSRNALKHGLTSRHLVIAPGEEEEFAELQNSLLDQVAPEGALEMTFFEQLIHAAWNIRRFRLLETQLMANGVASILDETNAKALDRLNRYAGSAQRSYSRALKELRTLQNNRVVTRTLEGETVDPVPELVSIAELTKRTQQARRGGWKSLHSPEQPVGAAITRVLQNEANDPGSPCRGAA